jgi:ankyrin repeat protein
MLNPKLFAQLSELSSIEKLQALEFLTAELAKEEGVKALSNSTTYRLWSPLDSSLSVALREGNDDIFQMLLTAGADINASNNFGETVSR